MGLEGVKVVVMERNSYPLMNSSLDIGKWIINRVEVNLLLCQPLWVVLSLLVRAECVRQR